MISFNIKQSEFFCEFLEIFEYIYLPEKSFGIFWKFPE